MKRWTWKKKISDSNPELIQQVKQLKQKIIDFKGLAKRKPFSTELITEILSVYKKVNDEKVSITSFSKAINMNVASINFFKRIYLSKEEQEKHKDQSKKKFSVPEQTKLNIIKDKIASNRIEREHVPSSLKSEIKPFLSSLEKEGYSRSKILEAIGLAPGNYSFFESFNNVKKSQNIEIDHPRYKPEKNERKPISNIKLEEYDPTKLLGSEYKRDREVVVKISHPTLGEFEISGFRALKIWREIAGV